MAVHHHINLGQQAAVVARLRNQPPVRARANVLLVGMAADDQRYGRVQLVCNAHNVAAKTGAARVLREAGGGHATLVDEQHNECRPLLLELGHQAVNGLYLVNKLHALHPGGNHHAGRVSQGQADKAHFDAVHLPNRIARKQGFAGGFDNHIGRQVLKCSAGKLSVTHASVFAHHTGRAVGIGREASARLQAKQLLGAFVKLVVAHAGEVQAQVVEHFHRGFIMKQARGQRRSPNQVTRAHHQSASGVLGLELANQRSHKRRTTGVQALACGVLRISHPHRDGRGQDVAVHVIDGEQANARLAFGQGKALRRQPWAGQQTEHNKPRSQPLAHRQILRHTSAPQKKTAGAQS